MNEIIGMWTQYCLTIILVTTNVKCGTDKLNQNFAIQNIDIITSWNLASAKVWIFE